MKTTGDRIDRIHNLAGRLESKIGELERTRFDHEKDFQDLFAGTAELLDLCRSGPAYVRERARRLNDLLNRLHRATGYMPGRFRLLLRQIDKIKDPVLSDYFSPSLQKRLDRLTEQNAPAARIPTRPLLLSLGNLNFCLDAPVCQVLRAVRVAGQSAWKFPRGPVDFFPGNLDTAFAPDPAPDRLNLLVARQKNRFLGLWFEQTARVSREEADRLTRNARPLERPHRLLAGKTKFAGRTVFIFKTN